MISSAQITFVAGGIFTIAASVIAQQNCVTVQGANGQITGNSIILNNVNYPNDADLQQAAASWNSSSCNSTGIAFPAFQFGSSSSGQAAVITVTYDPGPSNGVCAQTGPGLNITMFGSAILGNDPSRIANCNAVGTESFEHELGHLLGLGDSSCNGFIMDSNRVDSQGNFNSRSIQSGECQAADDRWETLAEARRDRDPRVGPGGGGWGTQEGNGSDSPIVINFDDGDYRLTGANSPVAFDMRGDGHPLRMGWTAAGADEAFLWLDRNHNGRVTSGAELFGNFTPLRNGNLAQNGFEALREFDNNNDGIIDDRDPIWSRLMLWRDLNHNGISEPGEIAPLEGSGVTAIDLNDHWTGRHDVWGNAFRYESLVSMANRSSHRVQGRPVYDIFFVPVRP